MNFCKVIDLFDDAGVDVRGIYWSCSNDDDHPDLLIQTDSGLRHVAAVELNADGDIIVTLEDAANKLLPRVSRDAANRLGEALG